MDYKKTIRLKISDDSVTCVPAYHNYKVSLSTYPQPMLLRSLCLRLLERRPLKASEWFSLLCKVLALKLLWGFS